MKPLYKKIFFLCALTTFITFYKATAQCPGGELGGTTAFDTTIRFPTGTTSIPVKFPQFDPVNGMVTCVKLCVTITGVIDTLAMQNYANSPQTAFFTYTRNDQITGPGIGSLNNSASLTYGPPGNTLDAYDLIPSAGPDFYSLGHDTILNELLCRTISDSTSIVGFYGHDSVTYNYDIDVTTNASITGGSSSSLVLTSAFVNFHFEYCTCPGHTLPISIKNFFVKKIADNQAELSWAGFDQENQSQDYHYVVEMSRNGRNFTPVNDISRNNTKEQLYNYIYTTTPNESGAFFFRIKQVYSNSYTGFSTVKQIYLENSLQPKFSIFPNPSSGIVGIKFDNIESGTMVLQVFDSRGQKVMQKNILVSGSSYQQVGSLQSGVYWLRVSDEKNRYSFVNQLLIK